MANTVQRLWAALLPGPAPNRVKKFESKKNLSVEVPRVVSFDVPFERFAELVSLKFEQFVDESQRQTAFARYLQNQKAKAKLPRRRIHESGIGLRDVVRKLIREHPDYEPKSLWTQLLGELNALNLEPEEVGDAVRSNKALRYWVGASNRTLTYAHFCFLIRDEKRKQF